MLELKNLTKQYDTNVIFKNLNLTVPDGEVLSIVGPSGIGKTTLLKIVAGLETANAGEMFLDNKAVSVSEERNTADIGLIFQDFNLFPNYTVLDNVMLAPITVQKMAKDQAKKLARELLHSLGLSDKEKLFPYQLSGGQKQRVAIARALAMQPQILAYDEPTSGLDEQSTYQVAEIIKDLKKKNVTQLVITHDEPFAKMISDRVFDFATEVER
ncbi:ATP-binding cassette domain-containing protein [Leuconostoc fallax]|uniref:amino acid ABC transporter ATP-binding protein n=1 Tax=Leuconostoc fallax TaxID=1251 RepID=UPI0020901ED0|nr:ATP-binding cassette domain-containing protein [Leuconostoc fallax]MCO6183353.1 ATP-binding cassette domain-containing protein [Leuconostoc fallax]